ncbi:MAG: hypothetical protein ABII90_15045 [Bacteroidota bacterium]
MKKSILFLLLIPVLFSCNTAQMESEIAQLNEEKQKLIDETNRKDSIIVTIVQSFNDIEENMDIIKQKESIIALNTKDATEFKVTRRDKIIEDIQMINKLMDDNRLKIESLSKKLKNAGIKMIEFEKMIARLTKTIEEKDADISTLKSELAGLNISLDSLSVAYQDKTVAYEKQTEVVDQQVKELHTAYYCFGTFKELKEQGVVTKEGGFIGIGRTEKLTDDFNKKYFTKIDITKITTIDIFSKKARLVTNHPIASYTMEGEDKADKLVITNPDEFWGASKYLVIIVE